MRQNREQELLARLSLVQKLRLSEAMDMLRISESTARRLFARLEQDGRAIRTHGGVQCINHAIAAYSFEDGEKTNIDKKTAIAREACSHLEDGDVVFSDSGTTIQCFCAELIRRLQTENLNIVVCTNSLANLELLSPYLPVKLLGGEYRANRKDFCGYMTEQALKGLFFTKSFVGADGCAQGKQFTTTDFETAQMNQIAMGNSEESFMLVDSSKFATTAHVAYVPVDYVDVIITDDEINPDTLQQLKQQDVRVICVNAQASACTMKIVD